MKSLLDRRRNPFFEHADAEYFLAYRGGKVVGRIAAISNRLHNETHDDRVGFFGFFETARDPSVASALVDAAAAWVRARGHDTLRGPASFSVNDECGLLVSGFESPPALMMPHNPPWYLDLLEGAGFHTAKNLLVYQAGDVNHVSPVPERLARGVRLIMDRQGITLRTMRVKEFDREVERIKRLYNAAWEKNWGFVPLTDHEIDHLAEQFRPVVVSGLVPFLEKDGVVVGFGLAMPDLNTVFRHNRRGYLLPVLPRLLWMLRPGRLKRIRILLLGVVPELRGKGLDAVLYHHIWSHGLELGYRWAEAGWILEDNAVMNAGLEKMGFTVYKTYRMLDRAV